MSPEDSSSQNTQPPLEDLPGRPIREENTGSDKVDVNAQLPGGGSPPSQTVDYSARTILGLAIPALGALIIEPLLTLIDSVMVGHLGIVPLAGLSLASTILMTLVGVFIFLAYSTTAVTAKLFGAGRKGEGIQAGIQAIWLAGGLGVALTATLIVTAPLLVSWLGADPQVAPAAVSYLRAGAPGMIGMLIILAATGTLRGLLDTRTPLIVLAAGAVINVTLNLILIYGLGWGLVGAGVGLSITQNLMASALIFLVMSAARAEGISLGPSKAGVLASVGQGFPLFVRTVSLRISLLLTVAIATQAGTVALASYQVVNSIWMMAAFALDALAIAAQGLVGVALGSGNTKVLRGLIKKLSWWGVWGGVAIGVAVALVSPWLPVIFGSDPQMHAVASHALLAAAAMMPLGGLVFILDGVLIGASQGPYLAKTGVVTLLLYLPTLGALHWWITSHAPLSVQSQGEVLFWLWVAFAGWFMFLRAVTNSWKAYRQGALTQ